MCTREWGEARTCASAIIGPSIARPPKAPSAAGPAAVGFSTTSSRISLQALAISAARSDNPEPSGCGRAQESLSLLVPRHESGRILALPGSNHAHLCPSSLLSSSRSSVLLCHS